MIAEIQPDVIGLQEVIRTDGAADADQPAYLASKLSMTVIMGATRPSGSGSFGNAILTRLPVIASTAHDLSHGRYERRGCLRVDLAADGAIVALLQLSLRPAVQGAARAARPCWQPCWP